MKIKTKICEGCKTPKVIFKRIEGKPYCQKCSYRFTAPKQIKKRSSKKIEQDKEYSILRKEYLEKHEFCQINTINCTHIAVEIHHTEYRGIKTNDINSWLAVCRQCHLFCHNNPIEARELGFLK